MTAPRDLPSFFAGLAAFAAGGPEPVVESYGAHPDQVAELRSAQASPARVAIVIHGGFWRASYTRDNTAAVAAALARAGYTTWNLEYRRVGTGGGYPETLADVAAFCRGPGRAADVAIGHSAGAQLALWAAAESLVGAAVALGGVCDLRAAAAAGLGDGAVVEFLGRPPEEAPGADPAQRLPLPVPALLVHGVDDDRVPVEQARAFAGASGARLLELPGAGHFDVIDPRAAWWPEIVEAIDALLS